jgi:hypothetical protein
MKRLQLPRCLRDEQAHFPMSGVKAQRYGSSIFRPQSTVRAENQEFWVKKTPGVPTHAGILRQAE